MLPSVTISPVYNTRAEAYLKFHTMLCQIQKTSLVPNKGVLQLGMPDTDRCLWTWEVYVLPLVVNRDVCQQQQQQQQQQQPPPRTPPKSNILLFIHTQYFSHLKI